MRSLLIGISILILLTTCFMVWWKTADATGTGSSSETFEINKPFLQVAIRLNDESVGHKINEASGCRILQSKFIRKDKEEKIRHIIYERMIEIDVGGRKRKIMVRDYE